MIESRAAAAQTRPVLVVVAVLPLIGAILLILKFALDAQGDPALAGRRLELLAQLLGPLLLGIGTTGLGLRIRKLKLGVGPGVIVIGFAYVVMILNNERMIAECMKTYDLCGEWSIIGYGMWGGMWLVDSLALIGPGAWANFRSSEPGVAARK